MSSYKKLLIEALSESGWEQDQIVTDGLEWWADEMWKLRSVKESWGFEIWLTCMVDPHWEGARRKGQGVGFIGATVHQPEVRDEESSGAALSMRRGRFDEKLEVFIADLDRMRSIGYAERD